MDRMRTIRKRLGRALGAAAVAALALGLMGSASAQPQDPNWGAGEPSPAAVAGPPDAPQEAGAPADTQWG